LVTVKLGDGAPDGSSTNIKVLASKELKLASGQQVWLRFKTDRVHFFDQESGDLLA
jgi:ABC-type sugar transport system ATPase subunit